MSSFATSIVATFIFIHNSFGVFSSFNLAKSSNLFEGSTEYSIGLAVRSNLIQLSSYKFFGRSLKFIKSN